VADIVAQTGAVTTCERGATRLDDHILETSVEEHKKEGYF